MTYFGRFPISGLDEFASIIDDLSTHKFFHPSDCAYPYNVKVFEDGSHVLEYALAGFKKEDVEIDIDDDKLIIKAKVNKTDDTSKFNYMHKGIAQRKMVHTVNVDTKYLDVKSIKAEMDDGILKVYLNPAKDLKERRFKVEVK